MANLSPTGVLGVIRRLLETPGVGATDDGALLARFAERNDQAAFTALVRRHGGLVRGVCERILGDAHDAEDVFQATFLVLARKAGSLQRPQAVANWLYGVAVRLARKARVAATQRRAHLQREVEMRSADPTTDVAWNEVRQLLDEELGRLPEKYRAPVILCYLEGRSRGEAAGYLGCSEGVVKGQLERGRELLRRRLVGRGVALSAGLFAAVLEGHATAQVPEAWVGATVRAAAGFAVGETLGACPGALALANGLILPSVARRWALVGGLLAAGILVAGTVGVVAHGTLSVEPEGPTETQPIPKDPAAWPPTEPRMVIKGQQPALQGGRVLLFSRSRHRNYPLASYAFHRGLRGDDGSVGNDVNLVFGNAQRDDALPNPRIDSVPDVSSDGAVGMDGFDPENRDEFRVTCLSGSQHRIVDLGKVDYAGLLTPPKALEAAADDPDADTAEVKDGHVYAIRLLDPEHAELREPRHIKLQVLKHRDNDAVLFVWAPLKAK